MFFQVADHQGTTWIQGNNSGSIMVSTKISVPVDAYGESNVNIVTTSTYVQGLDLWLAFMRINSSILTIIKKRKQQYRIRLHIVQPFISVGTLFCFVLIIAQDTLSRFLVSRISFCLIYLLTVLWSLFELLTHVYREIARRLVFLFLPKSLLGKRKSHSRSTCAKVDQFNWAEVGHFSWAV